jgi:DNA-binding NarL/FixJ family response regulator
MLKGTSSRRTEDSRPSQPNIHPPTPASPRVYVVSDVRLYREGLTANLDRDGRLNVLGVGSSDDGLSKIETLRPDVLLLDLTARYSLAIPRRARQILPALRVVAFAVAEGEENVLACAEAGISGYVAQDGSIEDLVAVVLHALSGEVVCSPWIAGLLFRRVATLAGRWSTTSIDAPLTPREREIAALVACNLPNKEIARRLRLGPATVKNHVHNILQKLNIHRRGEIAGLRLDPNVWRAATAVQVPERSRRTSV